MKDSAAIIISKVGRYITLKQKGDEKASERGKILQEILQKNKDIKNLNNQHKSTKEDNSEEDIMRNFLLITKEVKELRQVMTRLSDGIAKHNKQKELRGEVRQPTSIMSN